jgi:hypothetical protein
MERCTRIRTARKGVICLRSRFCRMVSKYQNQRITPQDKEVDLFNGVDLKGWKYMVPKMVCR